MRLHQGRTALSSLEYDAQWSRLSDFIKHNPGARHRRRLISDAIGALLIAPRSVLDVGCGLGELMVDLQRTCPAAKLSGLDLSSTAIETCRQTLPNATFHVTDITQGALDGRFDLIVCSEVLEHLVDPLAALKNIRTMSPAGGFLVVTTPHGRVHRTEQAIGHQAHPQRSELTRWLKDAGYEVVRLRQWGWPAYTILKYVANLAPETTMHQLGSGAYDNFKIRLNQLAYSLTHWLSVPTSPLGSQLVVTARVESR